MIIELMAVAFVIQQDIDAGMTQKQVAETYAMGLVSSWPTDWAVVNAAITKRWPKGLNRVKEMAWKIFRQKQNQRNSHILN